MPIWKKITQILLTPAFIGGDMLETALLIILLLIIAALGLIIDHFDPRHNKNYTCRVCHRDTQWICLTCKTCIEHCTCTKTPDYDSIFRKYGLIEEPEEEKDEKPKHVA